MNFKKLDLLYEFIEPTIEKLVDEMNLKLVIEDKNKIQRIYKFESNETPSISGNISIYKIEKTGKTTVSPKSNCKLSIELAEKIIENCSTDSKITRSFRIGQFPKEHFDDLVEYLQKEFNLTIEEGSNLSKNSGKQYIIKGEKNFGKCIINYYNKGSFQIQYGAGYIKLFVIEGLSNYLPYDKLISSQLNEYQVSTSIDDVEMQFDAFFPNSKHYFSERLKAILLPSIILKDIEVDLTDYTAFVFPALKGLEGYLKQLMRDKGHVIDNKGIDFVDKTKSGNYIVNDEMRTKIGCEKTCNAVTSIYRFMNIHRHGLFHANGIVEISRIIKTKQEAIELINSCFNLIDETYLEINS